jgi:formylmethanofuran dehydrogenase subunit E
LDVPRPDKRLLVLAETDGCLTDGLGVATGCWVGHRTMRIVDLGKIAATFVDTQTGQAVRIWPHPHCRARAVARVPGAASQWHAQLIAYQSMSNADLLCSEHVQLTLPLAAVLSRSGVRVTCQTCGEEIVNEREVRIGNHLVCRSCAGDSYYAPVRSRNLHL